MTLPVDYLEILKNEYPRRLGDNGWITVRTLIPRALTAGATWERILAGTRAYRSHCEKASQIGTAYVKQARTFYGPAEYWEEWADMQPVRSPAEIAEERQWEILKQRAKALNYRPPTTRDSLAAFETELRLYERDLNPQRDVNSVVSILKRGIGK